jgi:hypothetical protein
MPETAFEPHTRTSEDARLLREILAASPLKLILWSSLMAGATVVLPRKSELRRRIACAIQESFNAKPLPSRSAELNAPVAHAKTTSLTARILGGTATDLLRPIG